MLNSQLKIKKHFISGLEWSPEAAEVLYSLTSGLVLQAQVSGYAEDGLPEVYLYACYAKDVSKLCLFITYNIYTLENFASKRDIHHKKLVYLV